MAGRGGAQARDDDSKPAADVEMGTSVVDDGLILLAAGRHAACWRWSHTTC